MSKYASVLMFRPAFMYVHNMCARGPPLYTIDIPFLKAVIFPKCESETRFKALKTGPRLSRGQRVSKKTKKTQEGDIFVFADPDRDLVRQIWFDLVMLITWIIDRMFLPVRRPLNQSSLSAVKVRIANSERNHHLKTALCFYSPYPCLILKFLLWPVTFKCDNDEKTKKSGLFCNHVSATYNSRLLSVCQALSHRALAACDPCWIPLSKNLRKRKPSRPRVLVIAAGFCFPPLPSTAPLLHS